MKVLKVTLMIVDHDAVGADGVRDVIENTKYPNWCIAPLVAGIEARDIGEWSDDNPLNHDITWPSEFNRLFVKTQ